MIVSKLLTLQITKFTSCLALLFPVLDTLATTPDLYNKSVPEALQLCVRHTPCSTQMKTSDINVFIYSRDEDDSDEEGERLQAKRDKKKDKKRKYLARKKAQKQESTTTE